MVRGGHFWIVLDKKNLRQFGVLGIGYGDLIFWLIYSPCWGKNEILDLKNVSRFFNSTCYLRTTQW